MMKKCILLFLLICCVTVQAEIVNRYSFNDGDTEAVDSIGGKNGTLTNTATISGNKLVLNGSSAVELPSDTLDAGLTSVTIETWCQLGTSNTWARLFDFGGSEGANGGNTFYLVPNNNTGGMQLCISTTGFPSWQTGENNIYGTGLAAGVYTHVACVFDGSVPEIRLYINGQLAASAATTMDIALVARQNAYIGDSSYTGDPYFNGSIDEFRIYDTALSDDEVLQSFEAGADASFTPGLSAKKPNPKNGETDVSINIGTISWTPDPLAFGHNVFFGSDPNVGNATIEDLMGATVYEGLDVNSIDLTRLNFGTTYYWRVDEVNNSTLKEVYRGKLWSFTTEPEGVKLAATNVAGVEFNSPIEVYSYQDPNSTYNGKGLDDVNGTHSNENTETNSTMWVGMGDAPGDVWLKYELDQVYKLYQLQIWNYNEPEPSLPFGAKDVNILYSIDNVTWKALDEIQVFPMGTGESTYKADIFVNMNGAIAKYVKLSFLSSHTEGMYTGGISEIRFFVIPTRVTVPSPANNATNVDVGSILSWKAGRGVAVHKIYIDSDKNAVIDGTAAIKGETEDSSYSMVLGLGKTYYWKVDEVNDAEEYTTWDGPVWKFSTPQFILVDGFEIGYGNDPGKDAVFLTWKDGAELGDSSNGSYMGRKSEPYLQTINHSGGHSAPMEYDNQSYSYSEVKAETSKLAIGPDWSKGNPNTMEIWFRADANDVNEPVTDKLYAAFNDGNRIYYDGLESRIRRASWSRFNVPLDGIDLSNITSVTIGVEKIGGTGGIGTIYIDDIRLTIYVPADAVDPGTDNLIAYYKMENNVQDSSGSGLNGTFSGDGAATYVAGPFTSYGQALDFNPDTNDVVDLGAAEPFNFTGSFSISLWAKIQGWGNEWGHTMVATHGEGTMGFQIRRGGGWIGGMQGMPATGFCFTTRGISILNTTNSEDMMVDTPVIGDWLYITCIYDKENNTKSIYFDGELVRVVDTEPTAVFGPSTTNASIGARANAANSAFEALFNGMLDDVRFYDDALTDGEVKYLYKTE